MSSQLILASASPRRRELLALAGYQFECFVAAIDEESFSLRTPENFVELLAVEKAKNVAKQYPSKFVLGADTIVVSPNEKILGKPKDRDDARAMLLELSGSKHDVLTAYAIVNCEQSVSISRTISTSVLFRNLCEAEVEHYLDSDEPYDKAGAYGIQGFAGVFVEELWGSYSNVVGLPISQLVVDLEQLGISRF